MGRAAYLSYSARSMRRAEAPTTVAPIVVRRSSHLLDALVPLLAAGVIVVGGVVHGGQARPLTLCVGATAGAALAGRRRAPGATLLVTGALALVLVHLQPTAGATAI